MLGSCIDVRWQIQHCIKELHGEILTEILKWNFAGGLENELPNLL